MSFKIIADSSCDWSPEMMKKGCFVKVPMTLRILDHKITDDETFDQKEFLRLCASTEESPKSACPSPQDFFSQFEGEEDEIYVVTITSKLSGTYNCAVQGKQIYEEEHGTSKKIHIFDSGSASPGEVRPALKIYELASRGVPFEEIVETVEQFIQNQSTYFVLDNLEHLRKNGRLSNLQAGVLNMLHVKPIMYAVDGQIEKLSQDISMKRSLLKMCRLVEKHAKNTEDKVLCVSHCNNPDMGQFVLDTITAACKFKEAHLLEDGGLTTLYAGDGGIIVSF